MKIYLAEAATGGGVLKQMVDTEKVKYILVSYAYRTGLLKDIGKEKPKE